MHEELALQWVVSSGSSRELTVSNAWFFFELMVSAGMLRITFCDRIAFVAVTYGLCVSVVCTLAAKSQLKGI